jgi:hypothetical protein
VATDPFDSELLSAFAHLSRLYPALDLRQFRILWEEAGAFMDDALACGYEPHELTHLLAATEPPPIGLEPPRGENEPPGIEIKPSNVIKGPWDID